MNGNRINRQSGDFGMAIEGRRATQGRNRRSGHGRLGDPDDDNAPVHGAPDDTNFRVLTEQGPAAPGGAMSYPVNDHMVAGHSPLAVPAVYGETGIHTFLVSEAGTLYQADLGERTLEIGFEIESFDPGEGWEPVK